MAMMAYAALAKSIGLTLKPSTASTPVSVSTASQPNLEPSSSNNEINASQLQWSPSTPSAILTAQEGKRRTAEPIEQPCASISNSNCAPNFSSSIHCLSDAEMRQSDMEPSDALEEGELRETDANLDLQARPQFEVMDIQCPMDRDSDIASSRSPTPLTLSGTSNASPLSTDAWAVTSAVQPCTSIVGYLEGETAVGPPHFACGQHPGSDESVANMRERKNADAYTLSPRKDGSLPPLQISSIPATVTPDAIGNCARRDSTFLPSFEVQENASSKQCESRNWTDEQLHHAKILVLDLLGWGVTPEYLLQRGISLALLYTVFTDLQLRLPDDIIADCVSLVVAESKDRSLKDIKLSDSQVKTCI